MIRSIDESSKIFIFFNPYSVKTFMIKNWVLLLQNYPIRSYSRLTLARVSNELVKLQRRSLSSQTMIEWCDDSKHMHKIFDAVRTRSVNYHKNIFKKRRVSLDIWTIRINNCSILIPIFFEYKWIQVQSRRFTCSKDNIYSLK